MRHLNLFDPYDSNHFFISEVEEITPGKHLPLSWQRQTVIVYLLDTVNTSLRQHLIVYFYPYSCDSLLVPR